MMSQQRVETISSTFLLAVLVAGACSTQGLPADVDCETDPRLCEDVGGADAGTCEGCQDDPPVPYSVIVERDIGYSSLHDYTLNIAYPDAGGPYPAVIFIHGGGWAPLGKSKYDRTIQEYAAAGYVALTIDYPGRANGWREILRQGPKTVVKWLRANADTYRVDPSRIGATGGSAGGHLAAMLATTADDPSMQPSELVEYSDRVHAACAFGGSYDMEHNWTYTDNPDYVREILELVFGGAKGTTPAMAAGEYAAGSPVTHVTADDAPLCLCHGTADTTSPYEQVEIMATELSNAGITVETLVIEGAPHDWHGTEYYEEGRAAMDSFFQTVLFDAR